MTSLHTFVTFSYNPNIVAHLYLTLSYDPLIVAQRYDIVAHLFNIFLLP